MKKLLIIAVAALFAIAGTVDASAAPQKNKRPSVEEQVQELKKELKLNQAQYDQVLAATKASKDYPKGDKEAARAARKKYNSQMKKILTPKQHEEWQAKLAREKEAKAAAKAAKAQQ